MTLSTLCAKCRIQFRILLGLNWTDGWNESNLVALYDLANTSSAGTARCFTPALTMACIAACLPYNLRMLPAIEAAIARLTFGIHVWHWPS